MSVSEEAIPIKQMYAISDYFLLLRVFWKCSNFPEQSVASNFKKKKKEQQFLQYYPK